MPTGYTSGIVNGELDFNGYLFRCCRAFGACIELRDESLSAPIPEKFEPSGYHVKALASATAELERLTAMTAKERDDFGAEQKASTVAQLQKGLRTQELENERLATVRKQAEAWVPPTEYHVELKKFMLQQIDDSVSNFSYYGNEIAKAKAKSNIDWFTKSLDSAKNSVEYHINENKKEIERANDRTEWINAVRKSV